MDHPRPCPLQSAGLSTWRNVTGSPQGTSILLLYKQGCCHSSHIKDRLTSSCPRVPQHFFHSFLPQQPALWCTHPFRPLWWFLLYTTCSWAPLGSCLLHASTKLPQVTSDVNTSPEHCSPYCPPSPYKYHPGRSRNPGSGLPEPPANLPHSCPPVVPASPNTQHSTRCPGFCRKGEQ